MTKRPNKLGRIEGEPKVNKFKALPWKTIGAVVTSVLFVLIGILGTLKYQQFINHVKQQGVREYTSTYCERYADDKKHTTWLECDE